MRDTLEAAKKGKDDEFYTRFEDVKLFFDLVLADHPGLFQGKSVVLPCDTGDSAFTRYFKTNFDRLGLDELRYCWFNPFGVGGWVVRRADRFQRGVFAGHGDLCSAEVAVFISGADFLFTNPPFSLYQQFAPMLDAFNGHIGVVAPLPILTTKTLWPLVKSGRLTPVRDRRLNGLWFDRPDGLPQVRLGFALFATSIPLTTPSYTPGGDIRFSRRMCNYDGLEFSRFAHVPADYDGLFAVPAGVLASPMGGGKSCCTA